ncbi:MAG: DUF485 domain-containing protein [Rickettsiales bacterium]|nr:DUF485 domain-containing protein [Rickettsiales bacterium]
MVDYDYKSIAKMPEYQALLAKRRRLVWPLLFLTVIVYFAFILTIAFAPESLSASVGQGVISLGIYAGFGMILLTFMITGYYVYLANQRLEPLVEEIQKKLSEQ